MSTCGCTEYRSLSRRQFLGTSSAAAAALMSAPSWLPRVAYAQNENTSRDVLITIFLRGGCDGLSLCVPFADDDYYTARPTLNIPRPDSGDPFAATDLNGFFGLPPAMNPLVEAYGAGHLLFVHACGQQDESRSHFDAQNFMELGKPRDPGLFTGWIARHLLETAPMNPNTVLRAISMSSALQRSLAGSPLALPVPDPSQFGVDGLPGTEAERLATLEKSYAAGPVALRAVAENTLMTIELLKAIDFANYVPGNDAAYPAGEFGNAMKSAAALMKAEIGVEAITLDLGGWDTHDAQEPREGYMANLMLNFASTLAAFHADLTAGNGVNFTLAVMSEFGRVVKENANKGTDHGHGNVMLVMGNHIAGGQVLSNWPGLAPGNLFQGQDLEVTIDYRDILAEIIQNRLNNPNLNAVFPGFTPSIHGITT